MKLLRPNEQQMTAWQQRALLLCWLWVTWSSAGVSCAAQAGTERAGWWAGCWGQPEPRWQQRLDSSLWLQIYRQTHRQTLLPLSTVLSDFISFLNTEPFLYGTFTLKFFYQAGGLQLYFATKIYYKRST